MKVSKLQSVMALVLTLLIITINIFYTHSSKKLFLSQAEYFVHQAAVDKSVQLDFANNYGLNNLQLFASFCSSKMTEKDLKNPQELVSQFSNNNPFDFIEYIRWDGLNYMSSYPQAAAFDASDRPYYINGMKGISGIWANFKPKASREPLLNFYTPLYYKNEIAGVLLGSLAAQSSVSKTLESTFFDQKLICLLCNEDFTIVSSSTDKNGLVPGLSLKEYSDSNLINTLIKHAENKDYTNFSFCESNREGIASISNIKSSNWKIIVIALPDNLKAGLYKINFRMNLSFILVIMILLTFSFIGSWIHQRNSRKAQEKQNQIINSLGVKQMEQQKRMEAMLDSQSSQISILESIAGIYLTTHLIDLKTDTVIEFNTSREVRQYVNNNCDASKQMKAVINSVVDKKYIEEMLAFTNLETIAKRLKNKKTISKEFLGLFNGWVRASFIPVQNDDEGIPVKVLFVTQVIDEQKRKEERLITSANRDELTGLLNRHAYEKDLLELKEMPYKKSFIYASYDVNGLKIVNDKLGHQAGDELICGAADCLLKAIKPNGNIYRTGGDEFQAIIFENTDRFDLIINKLNELMDEWTGNLVDEIHLSAGYVSSAENPDLPITEIIKLADQRMYKAKSHYYNKKGIDRRGQQVAFELLSNQYLLILKVDLEKDKYTIIRASDETQKENMIKTLGVSFSKCLETFADNGELHKSDKETFLKKTNPVYLKKHFDSGKTNLTFGYKRKIGGRFHPVSMEIIASKDYSKENQTVFLYIKEV